MRLDAHGQVREFVVFFRPLPGLTQLTESLATRIVARRARLGAVLVAALIRPLVLSTRLGDRVAVWLLRRSFPA